MRSPIFSGAAAAVLLCLFCRPSHAAVDATLRYPALNDAALHTVCWTGSQFVAAGQGGVIFTSPDGTAWTSRHASLAANWRASAVGGGTVLLAGESGAVLTSTDGIAWTERLFSEFVYGEALVAAWNGSLFMIGWRYTSPDGITWTPVTAPLGSGNFRGLAVNGGQF